VPAVLALNDTLTGIVTVADHVDLRTGQDVTMMAWARVHGNAQRGFLFGRLNNATNGGWGLNIDATIAGGVRMMLAGLGGGPRTADAVMPANWITEWHHYAITFGGPTGNKTIKFYADGTLVRTSASINDAIAHQIGVDMTIGNRIGGALEVGTWGGEMYDLRYYKRVLTDDEVARACVGLDVSSDGLIVHMPLDDRIGTTARNLAGSGVADGVLSAGATWVDAVTDPARMPFLARAAL
jgi:hypothetical protein